MKHLVHEVNGEIKVVTGTVAELEQVETDGNERWYNAHAVTAEQAKRNYAEITGFEKWQDEMVAAYGENEDNWPEE
jgi:hypothetical protein